MSIDQYISQLALSPASPATAGKLSAALSPHRTRGDVEEAGAAAAAAPDPASLKAAVNVGSVLSFVDGIGQRDKQDVLYAIQLAQRGASGSYDRHVQSRSWYQMYNEILENLGWAGEQFALTSHDQSEGEFRMDKEALAIIAAIATQGQLAVLTQSIKALEAMADGDGTIKIFDFHASADMSGNFQLGAVQKAANGALSMALGAFYFRAAEARRRFLFFAWGANKVNFWTSAQKLTFNTEFYAQHRELVMRKLGADSGKFLGELILGAR